MEDDRHGTRSTLLAGQLPVSHWHECIGVSFPRLNELIHAKRGVTPDTALRLERLFGMEAQFWLNLQLAWDLYHAAHSPAARAIRKIRRLPASAAAGAD